METTAADLDTLLRRIALVSVVLASAAVVLLMPVPEAKALSPLSTHTEVDDDGYQSTIVRPGYRLEVELDGEATYAADESDLATLSTGGEFKLTEKKAGVEQRYKVEADRSGTLTRTYWRDGKQQPLDDAGRAWLKAALLTTFRTTGIDAEARAARLLARGPAVLLDEIALLEGDFVRAEYLAVALAAPALDTPHAVRAFGLAKAIGSDFELRRALTPALDATTLDAARADALLDAARQIGSDYELAELLVTAASRLPTAPGTIAAWQLTVTGVQSDFELRRAIVAAFEDAPAAYRLAALEAAAAIDSDFEMRTALEVVAEVVGKDPALLDRYLDRVEQMGSDFEQRNALTAIASRLTMGSPQGKRYLAIARGMGDFERGEALTALVDAGAL